MTTGWLPLLRLAVRRDRVLLPVGVLALVLSCTSSVQATLGLYPDVASRVEAARGVNANPALVAIYGRIADVNGLGGVATFKLLLLGGVFVALLCAVVVRRHTRLEEESGRAEILAATAIGRHALLTAAVVEASLTAVVIGALTAVGNVAVGLDVPGSVAFGLAWTGIGLTATAVTAVTVQLSTSTRTAGGLAAGVLGAAYALRAVGDVSAGWLSWLSPFGWATRIRPYGEERWWVFGLSVALYAGGLVLAVLLAGRRDLGGGLVPARPGPARGTLGSPTGLALRLNRASLLAWTGALALLGAVLGGIAPGVKDMLGSAATRDLLQRLGGVGRVVDTFLATEFAFVALGVSAFAVTVVTRAAGEEELGRTEVVLASATSRSRVFGASAALAFLGPVLLLVAVGGGAALASGVQQDGVGTVLGTMLGAALVQLPAIWVVVALALLLWGLRRAWTAYAWGVLAVFLMLGQVGELLGLPGWVVRLSPYAHVPKLPTESFAAGPELVLTAIAAVVAAFAWWRYRARDVG